MFFQNRDKEEVQMRTIRFRLKFIACHGYGCGDLFAPHGFASGFAIGEGSGSFYGDG